ncbi:MAG: M23 family metallopeptidase [Patescibacteria group bacterium]
MRFYFFLLFLLIVLISANLGFRAVFSSRSDMSLRRSGNYELASIDFNFFSSDVKNHISQGYGKTPFSMLRYPGGWHNGIDIASRNGSPIISASDGDVFAIGDQDKFCFRKGYGKFVIVKDKNKDMFLLYAHLGTIKVKQGDALKHGQVIGLVGTTGFETAPHLHFSVFEEKNFSMKNKNGCGPSPNGNDTSPFKYLDALDETTAVYMSHRLT